MHCQLPYLSGGGGAADLLRSEWRYSPGDCFPSQSPGTALGGAVAAGEGPGPAVLHPGQRVLKSKGWWELQALTSFSMS